MEVSNLKKRFPELVSHMESEGYSPHYIAMVRTEMNWIIRHAEGNRWESYADVHGERAAETNSPESRRTRKNAIEIIARFDLHGTLPDWTKRKSEVAPRGAYHQLNDGYARIVDDYRSDAARLGRKEGTIEVASSNASCFLLAMQEKGCLELAHVTEGDVVSFFRNGDGTLARGGSYRKNVAAVLRASAESDRECARVLLCLPELRASRKNVQRLTESEVSAIRVALADERSGLSLRDRAVGTTLLLTGLRGCDVASLRLDSIDWGAGTISIVQQKTETPLTLPLPVAVGNAIYDYLACERPGSAEPWVFLGERKPHSKLEPKSIGNVAAKVFRAAGVRQSDGDRRGTHIFRHNAVTSMLAGGAPRPVISAALGHSSPDSLQPYLGADIAHLRECSLGIERFPIAEGVLPPC